jgi:hypothetical protein
LAEGKESPFNPFTAAGAPEKEVPFSYHVGRDARKKSREHIFGCNEMEL